MASNSVDEIFLLSRPRRFVTFDGGLLIFTSVFLLGHAVAYYVSAHTNGIELFIENLLLIFVGGILAIVLVIRIAIVIFFYLFRQRRPISLALPVGAALLATFPFIGAAAVFYILDQCRFHMNRSFYVAEVENSNSSPKFVVFDWGHTEFVAWRTNYFLVFDENNSIARGLADPMDMPLPGEGTKCDTSVLPLYGSFYSVTVNCGPT